MPVLFKFLIIALFVGAVLVLPEQVYAAQCAAPKTVMQFKPTVSRTKYNISESAFDLHSFHGGRGGGLVTGLALSPLYYDFQSLFTIAEVAGGYCIAIDKLKIAYRARPVVFISNEFPRGSCEFKAVLFHENKHVRTLKRIHARTASAFKKHVENSLERVGAKGPVPKSQLKYEQEKLQKELQALLDEYITEVTYTLQKEQNKVDSPSEYAHVDGQCNEWS